jgi:hypothetical protein
VGSSFGCLKIKIAGVDAGVECLRVALEIVADVLAPWASCLRLGLAV